MNRAVYNKFFKNRLAVAGLIIVSGFLFAAVFASYLAPCSIYTLDLESRLVPPDKNHIMGSDDLGRDIFSRIIYGARVSLKVGIITVFVSSIVGIFMGSIAGYFGGRVDEVIMRIIDILLAFPGILLAVAVVSILGPSLNNVIIALCLVGWVTYARLVRGQILSAKENEYVLVAKALGAPAFRILGLHIIPNIMSPVLIQTTLGIAGAIVGEASLSFLGLGTQAPTPSWGSMLNDGRRYILTATHMTAFPGLAIMLVVMGFNFLGDGLRDALDPKEKV
ncbi:MAG: hypothetical protein A3C43_08715 [Candidatus Schekmanbacteria bacterium RIFCSPHIGHO2_02_FULL_38_11]|uniref:ABC transmembrane type-1 domain-containing protein n=1 Tax=Candidatus Schekmanbacteria bacterium RIFCSPLOWO2_12_FULL_38_15 TaxID=1817883 RepID=A0A1F7SC74_9BACT|nr:MAG: hypothetical protein A3C43_08715 [Candidatus Schekmanbacteria bacterium RIFCSPHIGHO2_02_FULL_38_11]OGL49315.1 MAG: hypothetical protein A3H37_07680 [Candidatus Schekmanbacteria bacterium RIFCSPLOWO2_02_FULL_38_14]OGL51375.1 MAG: hypothetical protein A3G31_01660 [Candidatus Schekmanbacteria bacterium RIFCSPLOWO2_12_FULL_38_15]